MNDNIFQNFTKEQDDASRVESNKVKEKFKRFLGKELQLRQAWERAAYVCMMFKAGFHWVNDEGVPDARDPNQLRRHVNVFGTTLRGLKNQITFNDPHVDVLPDKGQNATKEELDLASIVIRSEAEGAENGLGIKSLVKTMVDDSALKTFSMVSVMPNNDKDSSQISDIMAHDSFDVFFDNKDMTEAQMVVISSYEDKRFLESRGYINLSGKVGGQSPSHSVLKNEYEDMHGKNAEFDNHMVLIDSVYYIQHDTGESNAEDAEVKKDLDPTVMNVVFCGEEVIRPPMKLDGYNNLSQLFFLYYAEQDKHIKYPMPWMNDAVPLQRSLNDASENIDTLLHWYAKVRVMQRQGSSNTIQLVGDRHAQKLRYSGEKPEFMNHPAVPAELFRMIDIRKGEIEDMVGVHGSSMGKSSGNRVSGRKEAVLAAGDSDNVSEPVSNLETTLGLIFAQVLENAADNTMKVTKFYGEGDEEIVGIGTKALKAVKQKKGENGQIPTEIKPFKNIKAKIHPGSNMQLAQSRQEILEVITSISGEEMQDKREALLDILIRKYSVGLNRDMGKAFEQKQIEIESENADEHIIRLEIEKLARGETVTATPEQPHQEHIEFKMLALQEIGETDGPIFEVFMENIQQHDSIINPETQKASPEHAFVGIDQ